MCVVNKHWTLILFRCLFNRKTCAFLINWFCFWLFELYFSWVGTFSTSNISRAVYQNPIGWTYACRLLTSSLNTLENMNHCPFNFVITNVLFLTADPSCGSCEALGMVCDYSTMKCRCSAYNQHFDGMTCVNVSGMNFKWYHVGNLFGSLWTEPTKLATH